MKTFYILGTQFNGLEFVTYILIPSAIVLVILTYVYFNLTLLRLSFDFNLSFELDDKYRKKLSKFKFNFKSNKKPENTKKEEV